MVGWHQRLSGHEFEQASGVGDGLEACRATAHGVTKSWAQLSKLNYYLGFQVAQVVKNPPTTAGATGFMGSTI